MNYRLIFQFSSSFVLIGLFLLPCLTIAGPPWPLKELIGLFQEMGMTGLALTNFAGKVAINAVRNKGQTQWNSVKVGWPFYHDIPLNKLTVENDKSKFRAAYDFCSGKDNKFRGQRYVDATDPTVMLLYDKKGYLVGIQNGIRKGDYSPPENLKDVVYVDDGELWTRTAYFMNPIHICDASKQRTNPKEVADAVYIQNGPTFEHTFILPRNETDIKQQASIWTKGKTFPTQGQHYWYKMAKNLQQENFVPVFPLYSGWNDDSRQLMAFGWVTDAELRSPYYVHPTPKIAKIVMGEQMPEFMSAAPSFKKMSNIIVYLVENPFGQANGK